MTDPAPPRKNRLDDDVLKAAYQIANRHRDGHLSDRDWEQLACGDLDDVAKRAALSHVTSCETCSTIHRSLIALGQGSAVFDPQNESSAPAVAGFAWRRWAIGGGLAAAAVLMLAVFIDNPQRPRPAPAATRAESAGEVTITKPLALPDRRVQWSAIANADSYEVRINDAAGAPAWNTRLTATEAELPATLALAPGTYYLQVSALRDGAIVASSPLITIRVH